MKNSNDTIGNRTRDLPACSASASANCATACPGLLLKLFLNFCSSSVETKCLSRTWFASIKRCLIGQVVKQISPPCGSSSSQCLFKRLRPGGYSNVTSDVPAPPKWELNTDSELALTTCKLVIGRLSQPPQVIRHATFIFINCSCNAWVTRR